MASYDWLGIGVTLVAIAILLSVVGFGMYHDLEHESDKNTSDYLAGEKSRESYNWTKDKLERNELYLRIMNLSSSIILYVGLLMAIVGTYKRSEENIKEFKSLPE